MAELAARADAPRRVPALRRTKQPPRKLSVDDADGHMLHMKNPDFHKPGFLVG